MFDSITTPDALHAFYLTILVTAIAVPLNTVFGVGCALLAGAARTSAARR